MVDTPSKGELAAFMEDLLARHGDGHEAVSWPTESNQRERFKLLLRNIPQDVPFTLIDLGCGLGHLLDYILETGRPIQSYVGLDISPAMVKAASDRTTDPRASFSAESLVGFRADYVVASGIFNLPMEVPRAEWADYMRQQVRQMFAAANIGIAFNSLTTHVSWREPHLFYADPAEWLDWASRELNSNLALDSLGSLYEWAMFIDKRPRR